MTHAETLCGLSYTYVDLFEIQLIGTVCLYSRQANWLANMTLVNVTHIDSWSEHIIDLFVSKYNSGSFFVSGANTIWSSAGVLLKYVSHSNEIIRVNGLRKTFDWIWNGCMEQSYETIFKLMVESLR